MTHRFITFITTVVSTALALFSLSTAPAWAQRPLAIEPLENPNDSITPQPFLEGCTALGQWPTVAARTAYYGNADWSVDLLSDSDQTTCFANLNGAGIGLSLGVGVLKPQCQDAQTCFDGGLPKWRRMRDNGALIGAFFLDEPFTAVRKGWVGGDMNYAVAQTKSFISQLRQEFPNALIIEQEAYPFIEASVLQDWITAIGTNGNAPDYFEVDHNMQEYSLDPSGDIHGFMWLSHNYGMGFALLLAAAGPGYDDYQDWYTAQYWQHHYYSELPGGYDILSIADLYHVSAFSHTPRITANENQPYSFMYTVKSFLSWYY